MANLKSALSGLAKPGSGSAPMAKKKKHPGFKVVQSSIAKKEGVSKDEAGAMLASASRKASSAAKSDNPKLKKVK